MQGLRTQEESKFENFFSIVQEEAKKRNAIFFCDCGQGDIFENDKIECEDMCGWLIPLEQAEEFEKLFIENAYEQHKFDDPFYIFIDFNVNDDGSIEIMIDDSSNY